nr:hypothetical protein BaRGS_012167 [Batillaria attramentaria]
MKKHGPGEELSCGTLLKNAVKYRLHVGFTDAFRFDTHEKDVKSFLGKPVLAQVGKDSASMAMLNEFCCSKDPGSAPARPVSLDLDKLLTSEEDDVKGFRPSDICFHVVDNKEVLLVSDEANNVIYVLDFSAEYVLDGRVDKRRELGAGCPWLTAPTSMAVDKSGVLKRVHSSKVLKAMDVTQNRTLYILDQVFH